MFKEWEVIFLALNFILSLLVAVGGGTWALSRNNTKLVEKFRVQVEKERKEIDTKIDEVQRNFGETAQALRTKLSDVELWNRDNFVSKETFRDVIGDIKSTLLRVEEKIDLKLDRMDRRLEARGVYKPEPD